MNISDDLKNIIMRARIGHRVESMTNEELQEELRSNEAMIEALNDTNTAIENELYHRKNSLCESCQGKGQYDAGILIGYIICQSCNNE